MLVWKRNSRSTPVTIAEKLITSADDLEDHRPICISIKDFTIYPCDVCCAQCTAKTDLEEHKTDYHQQIVRKQFRNAYPFDTEEDLNSCDFCGIKFGTLGGLRSLQKDMLPT
jgi:hypothetical protein